MEVPEKCVEKGCRNITKDNQCRVLGNPQGAWTNTACFAYREDKKARQ